MIKSYDFFDYYIKTLYELNVETCRFKVTLNFDIYTKLRMSKKY